MRSPAASPCHHDLFFSTPSPFGCAQTARYCLSLKNAGWKKERLLCLLSFMYAVSILVAPSRDYRSLSTFLPPCSPPGRPLRGGFHRRALAAPPRARCARPGHRSGRARRATGLSGPARARTGGKDVRDAEENKMQSETPPDFHPSFPHSGPGRGGLCLAHASGGFRAPDSPWQSVEIVERSGGIAAGNVLTDGCGRRTRSLLPHKEARPCILP
jgi:hypothetical protein